MKTFLTSAMLALTIATASFAQSFLVDTKASQLTWTGYAEVGSWAPSGTIHLKKGQLIASRKGITSGTITIDMTTIQQENDKLQAHLLADDFFDTEHFPTAAFVLQSLTNSTATGLLTLKGATKPISFPVVVSQGSDDIHVKGKAVVDRTQFGIRYNSASFFSGLGDYAIRNEFSLVFDVVARPVVLPKEQPSR